MNNEVLSKYETPAEILKILGHPIRLCIAIELSKGELCVYKINDIIQADTSTVSKHLSLMKAVNIVKSEKRGNCMYYSLNMRCVPDFMLCTEQFISDELKDKLGKIESPGASEAPDNEKGGLDECGKNCADIGSFSNDKQ